LDLEDDKFIIEAASDAEERISRGFSRDIVSSEADHHRSELIEKHEDFISISGKFFN
jgi:hypothetical protein